jgi:hypothetical protein
MSELANDFGMSDVGLAKRCRAVDVPIPYRGYWARKAAGPDPPKIPLPKYRSLTPTATAEVPTPAKTPKTVHQHVFEADVGKLGREESVRPRL